MNALGVVQILLFIVVLVALVKPLGTLMAKVYDGERTFLSPVLGPIERGIYRLAAIKPSVESNWNKPIDDGKEASQAAFVSDKPASGNGLFGILAIMAGVLLVGLGGLAFALWSRNRIGVH